MRKAAILLVLLAAPSLFAQYRNPSWRDRQYSARDNMFELTPFVGYRWGGTIRSFQTDLFKTDVDLASTANIGATFGIPINDSGMKVELMVNHQSTHFTTGSGLFEPGSNLGDVDVTYYHGGLLIPFADSRNATPFIVISAGLANIDPKIKGVTSENKFSASAGVGVKVPINRNVGLRVEARGFFTALTNNTDSGCSHCGFNSNNDDNLYQGEVNMGVTFKF
ncbi:MAG: outer membrane beta-barrel protein [Thermoanaerobaculia bacterium]